MSILLPSHSTPCQLQVIKFADGENSNVVSFNNKGVIGRFNILDHLENLIISAEITQKNAQLAVEHIENDLRPGAFTLYARNEDNEHRIIIVHNTENCIAITAAAMLENAQVKNEEQVFLSDNDLRRLANFLR